VSGRGIRSGLASLTTFALGLVLVACGSDERSAGPREIGATATGPDIAEMCDPPQQAYAAAYDRATGEFRWAACEESPGFRFLKQVTDDAVYLVGPDPTLTALDPDSGDRIEATQSPPPTTPVLTGQPGQPYTTVVDGVTISGGQDDPTTARSVDGKLVWEHPGHWTYDDVAAIDDGAVFAVEYLDNGDSRLVGYEIDNGEIRWEANGEPHLEGLLPWLADDQQLFTGWANLQARSTQDGGINWTTRWSVEGQDPFAPGVAHVAGLAVDDDTVYIGLVSDSGPGD